jgi:uncharacterized coiled-coil DUF342 family protein
VREEQAVKKQSIENKLRDELRDAQMEIAGLRAISQRFHDCLLELGVKLTEVPGKATEIDATEALNRLASARQSEEERTRESIRVAGEKAALIEERDELLQKLQSRQADTQNETAAVNELINERAAHASTRKRLADAVVELRLERLDAEDALGSAGFWQERARVATQTLGRITVTGSVPCAPGEELAE